MHDSTKRFIDRIDAIPPLDEISAEGRFTMAIIAATDEFVAECIREKNGDSLRKVGFTAVAGTRIVSNAFYSVGKHPGICWCGSRYSGPSPRLWIFPIRPMKA